MLENFPGRLLRLDPAFAYAKPPSSRPLPGAELAPRTTVSRKVQMLLLTLYEGYRLTATPPDLEHGVAPLGPPVSTQLLLLGHGVDPLGCHLD